MRIESVSINIYPACTPSDMHEFIMPSAVLTAEVNIGECNEYGYECSVASIKDHAGNEIYKNTGNLASDIKEIQELYIALGWKKLHFVYSLFDENNGYSFISRALEKRAQS